MSDDALPKVFVHPQELELMGVRYSNSHRLKLEKDGLFPERVYLSPQKPVYVFSEIKGWIEKQSARRGGAYHA